MLTEAAVFNLKKKKNSEPQAQLKVGGVGAPAPVTSLAELP